MNIKSIKIITVGKIKTSFFKEAYLQYINRVKNFMPLQEFSVKDANPDFTIIQRKEKEGQGILKNVNPNDFLICLDEHGKNFDSVKLAELCDNKALEKNLCFVVGGAYGLSEEVLKRADLILSFGKQTFPHELAQVVLSEQLFRICAILKKTGYHHL